MRFVLSFSLVALLSTSSFAAPWDIVPLKDSRNAASQAALRPVQMQRGGSSNELQTIDELELEIAATGLGDISAIAIGEDGTLYTLDAKTGRIWTLPDRGQDGKIDVRRPLPFTFDTPTGLAIIGATLYVADRNAVWAIETGQEPRELASLVRAGSSGGPHLLLPGTKGETLTLGLTTKTQGFRLLELNINSGEALLIGEGLGELHSLAQRQDSKIWAASATTLSPIGSEGLEFATGQAITALALPGQYETPRDWPPQLKDHIIAAQTGPRAMQLIAIPTEFGQASAAPRVLVQGFLTSTGRSAWGKPGPLVMDKRGLFIVDPNNGSVWRLSPKPRPQAKITIVDTASLPPRPNEPKLTPQAKTIEIKSTIQGTQINTKSTIVAPSSIIYGSKLIKDYDEKKAAEEAEKAESEPKKKTRRMSRKRKQKDD